MVGFSVDDPAITPKKNNAKQPVSTILDEFPEYDFVTASRFLIHKVKRRKLYNRIFGILFFLDVIAILSIFIAFANEKIEPKLILSGIILGPTLILYCVTNISMSKTISLYRKLYYIQNPALMRSKGFRYGFYVNQKKKFGLIEYNGCKVKGIIIPAAFDKMAWKENNKYVILYKDSKTEVRDVNDTLCI